MDGTKKYLAPLLLLGVVAAARAQNPAPEMPSGFIPPAQVPANAPPPGNALPLNQVPAADYMPNPPPPMPAPPISMPPVVPAPACAAPACDACVGGPFVDGEYLLMKPTRRETDFVIIDPTRDGTAQGPIESVNWDTGNGFRVGGGYRLPGAGWEVGTYYTYLHSNGTASATAPTDGTLFATMTHPGGIEQVDTADAGTTFNYQILDLEIGRRFEIGDSFSLRLFGGGRFAWIKQSLNVLYNGGDASDGFVASPVDFYGAGIRAGGEGDWHVWGGFSVFVRAACSLMEGNFHTSMLETNNSGATIDANVTDSFEKMVPVAELGVGVAWYYRNFYVSAAYEMIDWFNLIDSPGFTDDTDQGKMTQRLSDLSLQGLVLRAGMSF